MCSRPAFRDFLAAKAQRPVPDAGAAACELREMTGVLSRREFDTRSEAADRYGALVAEFNAWRR